MAVLGLATKGYFLVLVQFMLQMSMLIAIYSVIRLSEVTFQAHLQLSIVAIGLSQFTLFLTHGICEMALSIFEFLGLFFDNLKLCIENKFLAFHCKALFGQFLQIFIKITPHLSILRLQ